MMIRRLRLAGLLLVAGIMAVVALPVRGGEGMILQPPPGLQFCDTEASHPRLRLGPAVQALPAETHEAHDLDAFLAALAAEDAQRGDLAEALRWLRDPVERARMLRARVPLRSFMAGDQQLTVLRLAHSGMTCGSGGCSTPVLVATGCRAETGLACLQAAHQAGRLHVLYGDTLLIARQAGAALVQTRACACSGPAQCSGMVTLWRVDADARLHRDAYSRWDLASPLIGAGR